MIRRSNGRVFEYSKKLQLAIKQHAQRLISNHGDSGPPYDPFLIAEKLDVQVAEEPLEGIDGYVQIKDGRYCVSISSLVRPVRQRFTLAHELCHVWLMRQAEDGYPAPLIRYRKPRFLSALHQDPAEEYLCNYFASELLIPREELTKRFEGQVVQPKSVLDIARDFQVSKQTAAIQLSKAKKIVSCCLWNLESLWPQPVWWTGHRTSYQSEILQMEKLLSKRCTVTELWESYGKNRLRVILEAEPSPKKRVAVVVIRQLS